MPKLSDLKIELWADGADFAQMVGLSHHPLIRGFTTNPSLLRKAGVTDYDKFIKEILCAIPDKPISFEVLADDLKEMERQARKLAAYGSNVYVKIPCMTTRAESTVPIVVNLLRDAIAVNVTALMTDAQISRFTNAAYLVREAYGTPTGLILSVFCGRITDAGESVPTFYRGGEKRDRMLWASTREVWNIFSADQLGYDLITLTMEQIQKLDLIGKDLTEYSRETVQQFYDDGVKANLLL